MNLETIQPKPVVCRQSSIGCALKCKRKWWCKYRMGITLRGVEIKESADLGKIYHRLQCLGPGSEPAVKAEIRKQQQALMDRVGRGEDLDGQISRLAGMLTELYNKAEVMARIFWERYPQPDYFQTIGTEIKHTMEWQGLILEGTIDKLLFNNKDGSLWIRDHKSTGLPLDALFSGLAWSLQGRLYRILADDFYKHLFDGDIKRDYNNYRNAILRGFILDGILKPGIKLCKTDQKNAKDWNVSVGDAYLRRVKEWYAEKNEEVMRSRSMLFTEPLFPDELTSILTGMGVLAILDPRRPENFVRDVTRQECFAYRKQCIYHDLCSTDPKQWDQLFETKYRIMETEDDSDDERGIGDPESSDD